MEGRAFDCFLTYAVVLIIFPRVFGNSMNWWGEHWKRIVYLKGYRDVWLIHTCTGSSQWSSVSFLCERFPHMCAFSNFVTPTSKAYLSAAVDCDAMQSQGRRKTFRIMNWTLKKELIAISGGNQLPKSFTDRVNGRCSRFEPPPVPRIKKTELRGTVSHFTVSELSPNDWSTERTWRISAHTGISHKSFF